MRFVKRLAVHVLKGAVKRAVTRAQAAALGIQSHAARALVAASAEHINALAVLRSSPRPDVDNHLFFSLNWLPVCLVDRTLLVLRCVSHTCRKAAAAWQPETDIVCDMEQLAVLLRDRPPQLPVAVVNMLAADGLSVPTFAPARQALAAGGDVGAIVVRRVQHQRKAIHLLHNLQCGRPTVAVSPDDGLAIAKLAAPMRTLLSIGIALAPPPLPTPPASAADSAATAEAEIQLPVVRYPDYLTSLHAGKPADLFEFRPWPNNISPKGDVDGQAAVRQAEEVVLPSLCAVVCLIRDEVGRKLLSALDRKSGSGARPSRFAILSAAFDMQLARCELLNLVFGVATYQFALAMVHAACRGYPPPDGPT